ncbi:DUF2971 domain-containing protein [Vibrio sp. 10N.286.46.E10]|uniref:DUF2971 domain-containing protein n=1 Tax=Vibrio sp. 10N.286.46.E10 TaxID=1884477 RepID=UPI000C83B370|nr:DUF2971 domain-containing protein [Vibrio sp. 10N.286.46.E10]PMI20517.1 hypothetical protein BCU50_17690 [Vibrio sp. 10N.286.46.E10]
MNWVEEFAEKLFPLNRSHLDIDGAYLFKDSYLPSSIFKYRKVNEYSLSNLEEDTVWLADPSNFNDPYDCAHTVDYDEVGRFKGNEFLNTYLTENREKMNFTKGEEQRILADDNGFDLLVEHGLSQMNISDEDRSGMKEVLISVLKQMMEDLTKHTSEKLASSFKLCSFSERNDSMLMWAHYADYHKGFCIEYDLTGINPFDYRRRFLYPTIYSDLMFDATSHFKKDVNDISFNNLHLTKAALVKAIDWQYEKEWRLIFAHGLMDKEQPYFMGKPKAVYLGTKISDEHQNKILEICSRKGIGVYKMKPHHKHFSLKPVEPSKAELHFFKNT